MEQFKEKKTFTPKIKWFGIADEADLSGQAFPNTKAAYMLTRSGLESPKPLCRQYNRWYSVNGIATYLSQPASLQLSYLCVFLIAPFLVFTQAEAPAITSTQILQSAWQSKVYSQRQQELSFLQDAKLHLPFMEEVELRTETQEFDPARQEYAVRLQFNSPKQRKVAAAIKQQEINLRTVALHETLEQVLYDRYQLVLDIALAQQEQQYLQEQQIWFSDQKTVLERIFQQEGEQRLDDLLKLEDQQLSYTKAQLESDHQLERLNAELTQLVTNIPTDDVVLAPIQLLAVDALTAKLSLYQPSSGLTLPWQVQAQAVQVELLHLEVEGELAEQKNLLQFLQLRYTGDDDPFLEDRFTVGAGVRLPFRNANSVKQQYLALEQLEEEHQQIELLEEWAAELQATETKLAIDLRLYQDLQKALASFQNQYAPLRLRDLGVTDVQVLLQAQGGIYHRKKLCLEQAEIVYKTYLDLLLLSGRLAQAPYRNWWSEEDVFLVN